MKKILLYLTLLIAVLSTDDKVLILDDKNFDQEISKHEMLLIEFYAPWCGHCKTLEPEWNKAAEILSKRNPPLLLAKVDATANNELSKRFSISGFPTIKFYTNGNYVDYNGGRKAEDIVSWYKKKSGPPSVYLKSVDEINEIRANNEISVIYFGKDDSESFKQFEKVANENENVIFGHCSVDECLLENVDIGDIVLFKNLDEEKSVLKAGYDNQELINFIENNMIPLVSFANDFLLDFIFNKNKLALFYFAKDKKDTFVDVIKITAPEYKNRVYFVISLPENDLTSHLAEYYGFEEKDFPQIRLSNIVDDENVTHYKMQNEFTSENLRSFLNDFFDGNLNPHIKSEPVPETQEQVYKLVATTFNEKVMNQDKHVLVEFYAPWCGHCQKLAPEYEKLAEVFKSVENLLIAKIDASSNDVDFPVEGFPTIVLFKNDDKLNPIVYKEGERNFESLKNFLNINLGLNVQEEVSSNTSDKDLLNSESSGTIVNDESSDKREDL